MIQSLGTGASLLLAAVSVSSVMACAFSDACATWQRAAACSLSSGGPGSVSGTEGPRQIVERRQCCLVRPAIIAHRQIGGAAPVHVEPLRGARERHLETVRQRGIGAVRRQ